MAKKKKKRIDQVAFKNPYKDEITSAASTDLNITSAHESPGNELTTHTWASSDSTNAPKVGEDIHGGPYVTSTAGLLDKVLFGKLEWPFFILGILFLIIFAIIVIQDNQAGKLSNWTDLWWTLKKSLIVEGVVCVVGAVLFLLKRLSKK